MAKPTMRTASARSALRRFETSLKRLNCANTGHCPRFDADPEAFAEAITVNGTAYRRLLAFKDDGGTAAFLDERRSFYDTIIQIGGRSGLHKMEPYAIRRHQTEPRSPDVQSRHLLRPADFSATAPSEGAGEGSARDGSVAHSRDRLERYFLARLCERE